MQDWDALPADERKLYARMMEVFAGFLEHTDHHIGRLVDFLDAIGELDNTLIMLISDNGASSEGGPTGSVNENKFFNNVPDSLEQNLAALDDLGGPKYFNHYAWGWTWAGNTPFRRWKRETFRGGVTDPFIVHWPKGIKAKGEIRTQYAHAVDMVPTVLDALGVDAADVDPRRPASHRSRGSASPTRSTTPRRRRSTSPSTSRCSPTGRSTTTAGGRCARGRATRSPRASSFGTPLTADDLKRLDGGGWELYHVDEDASECHDVAADNRDRLIEMISLWYAEAGKYNVLPLDGRGTLRLAEQRPQLAKDRQTYVYYPHTQAVPAGQAVRVLNRPHTITADVEIPTAGAEGVLLSMGGVDGGFTFFVKDGKLHYTYNYVAADYFRVSSDGAVPDRQGRAALRVRADRTARHRQRQGHTRPGPAVRRPEAGRPDRAAVHDPARPRSRRRRVRRPRRGLAGLRRLPRTVRVHRHDPPGDRRRLRRPHRRRARPR